MHFGKCCAHLLLPKLTRPSRSANPSEITEAAFFSLSWIRGLERTHIADSLLQDWQKNSSTLCEEKRLKDTRLSADVIFLELPFGDHGYGSSMHLFPLPILRAGGIHPDVCLLHLPAQAGSLWDGGQGARELGARGCRWCHLHLGDLLWSFSTSRG